MALAEHAQRTGSVTVLEGRRKVMRPASERPAATEGQLYASRVKIHPAGVRGKFRTAKWAILALAMVVYYGLPFLRWDRGAGQPDQAVLLDLDKGRFYFFFIELWPQDVTYVMGLLILAALILFAMNAVAGRVWCGYFCPQTVWTDLFMAVERLIEGDRRARMKLDAAPMSLEKFTLRLLKHSSWLMIAWWTGGAWVLYFADAPTLVVQLATFSAPPVAYAAILVLTGTTYLLAGHMREQVCTYMCPWPRIQGALTDKHSLAITYRYDRGEPRVAAKKADALRAAGQPAGDCVDCFQCVTACPAGIDIRDGLQMECIQCGLCADACNTVMLKLGRPEGLIAYDTDANCQARAAGKPAILKPLRVRTLLYAAMIAGVGGTMLYNLVTRDLTGLSVLHDRNPIFVTLADGSIRNGYTLRVLNKRPIERVFTLAVESRLPMRAEVVGASGHSLRVPSDSTQEFRVLVFSPAGTKLEKSTELTFVISDPTTGDRAMAEDHFKAP
ncbi:cytochrome c oxidase accessory protein CcoG [Enterovirga sp. CN4-39]|uniref:cytochrome c oxidase accessory protein CcoG n=1 Tax=Enterovirga sp. CN4-39 TaxID=3400910 RepID=UPI003C072E8D